VLKLMFKGIMSVDAQVKATAFKAAHEAMLQKPDLTLSEALKICHQFLSTQCSEAALRAGLMNVQKGFAELDRSRVRGVAAATAPVRASVAAPLQQQQHSRQLSLLAWQQQHQQQLQQFQQLEYQYQQQKAAQQHQQQQKKTLSNNTNDSNSSSGSSSSSSSSGCRAGSTSGSSTSSSSQALPVEWNIKSNSNTLKLQLVQVIKGCGARSTVKSELIRLLLDSHTGHVVVELDHVVATADEAISEVQLSQQLGNMIVTSPLLRSAEREQLLTRLSKVT
jgi:hypothetical protein